MIPPLARRAAVFRRSEATRNQPQHSAGEERAKQFQRLIAFSRAAAGLRHSRCPFDWKRLAARQLETSLLSRVASRYASQRISAILPAHTNDRPHKIAASPGDRRAGFWVAARLFDARPGWRIAAPPGTRLPQ